MRAKRWSGRRDSQMFQRAACNPSPESFARVSVSLSPRTWLSLSRASLTLYERGCRAQLYTQILTSQALKLYYASKGYYYE